MGERTACCTCRAVSPPSGGARLPPWVLARPHRWPGPHSAGTELATTRPGWGTGAAALHSSDPVLSTQATAGDALRRGSTLPDRWTQGVTRSLPNEARGLSVMQANRRPQGTRGGPQGTRGGPQRTSVATTILKLGMDDCLRAISSTSCRPPPWKGHAPPPPTPHPLGVGAVRFKVGCRAHAPIPTSTATLAPAPASAPTPP